jgi:flagellar basal body-associated protein FliL
MTEEAQKKSRPIIYIVLIVILALLVAIAAWFYFDKSKEVAGLQAEKEQIRTDLQQELDELMVQHNQIKKDYGNLSDTLASRDSAIRANAEEIENLLNYKWEYYLIKKKLDRLRVTAQKYVRQMDSLYTVNQELTEENERIRESFRTEQMKNSELKIEKKELETIVEDASVLRAYNVQATGIRQRGSNQKETDKARRTDRVRVCFTLGENSLIDKGEKNIYIRISRPDKAVLMIDDTEKYAFSHNGEKLQYSIMRTIKYDGEAVDICAYWNRSRSGDEEAMVGTYFVDIYTDEDKIGEGSFELR